MVQLNVGRRTASEKLQVPRIVTLPRENGDNTLAPNVLDRVEDTQLIVDHYVPLCRVNALNLGEFALLMDIDQHAVFESRPEPGALDLPRLEHRIAIGKDDRRAPLADVLDDIKRAGIKPVGKRIIDEPARHPQHPWIVHLFKPEPLQCTEIVRIAELLPQFFKNVPVKVAGFDT